MRKNNQNIMRENNTSSLSRTVSMLTELRSHLLAWGQTACFPGAPKWEASRAECSWQIRSCAKTARLPGWAA